MPLSSDQVEASGGEAHSLPSRSSQSTIISSRSLIPSAPPPAARLILAGSTLFVGSTVLSFPFLVELELAGRSSLEELILLDDDDA